MKNIIIVISTLFLILSGTISPFEHYYKSKSDNDEVKELVAEVKAVLENKVPSSETNGRQIDWYNDYKETNPNAVGKAKIKYKTKLIGDNGVIEVKYSRVLYDSGKIVNECGDIHSTWFIKKIDGKWDIIRIEEDP